MLGAVEERKACGIARREKRPGMKAQEQSSGTTPEQTSRKKLRKEFRNKASGMKLSVRRSGIRA
jgi:hypothetical protein